MPGWREKRHRTFVAEVAVLERVEAWLGPRESGTRTRTEEATRDLRATDLERRVEDSVDGSSTRLLFFDVSFSNMCMLLQRGNGLGTER